MDHDPFQQRSDLEAITHEFEEYARLAKVFNNEVAVEGWDEGRGYIESFDEALKDQIEELRDATQEYIDTYRTAYSVILRETVDVSIQETEDDIQPKRGSQARKIDMDRLHVDRERLGLLIERIANEYPLEEERTRGRKEKFKKLHTYGASVPDKLEKKETIQIAHLMSNAKVNLFTSKDIEEMIKQYGFKTHIQRPGQTIQGYAMAMQGASEIYIPELGFEDGRYEHADRIINRLILKVQERFANSTCRSILLEVPQTEASFADHLVRERGFGHLSDVFLDEDTEFFVLKHIAANKR